MTRNPWEFAKTPFDTQDWAGDFLHFLSDEDLVKYAVTAVNSGTGAVIDTRINRMLGVLQIANAATADNSGAHVVRDALPWSVENGCPLVFVAKVQVTDADECDLRMGFTTSGADWLAGGAGLDTIDLRLDDGSAVLKLVTTVNNVAVTTNLPFSLQDGVPVHLGMLIEPDGTGSGGRIVVGAEFFSTTLGRPEKQTLFEGRVATLPMAATVGPMADGVMFHSGTNTNMVGLFDYIGVADRVNWNRA